MTTVQEFKAQYGITDTTFRRYRAKAEEAAGKPIVERGNGNDWIILDVDALLAVMPAAAKVKAPTTAANANDDEIAIDAIIVSETTNSVGAGAIVPINQTGTSQRAGAMTQFLELQNQQTIKLVEQFANVAGDVLQSLENTDATIQAGIEAEINAVGALENTLMQIEAKAKITRRNMIEAQAQAEDLKKRKQSAVNGLADLQALV